MAEDASDLAEAEDATLDEAQIRKQNKVEPTRKLCGAEEFGRNFEIPKGRNCIKNKWVFKTKRNGIFRARSVACGYSQIPREDFQEKYAPVINVVTFRILSVTLLTSNLIGKVIDIETAFLHGNLKDTKFMEIPKGMDSSLWFFFRHGGCGNAIKI
jgi:Reverse transcriptase (RNA-dependent DNA polymerase)